MTTPHSTSFFPSFDSTFAAPPAGNRKEVIVLGAGLAGLSAAYELVRWGHRVTILEARDRAGGKVHTIHHPFADGLYVEAGAVLLPASHTLTMGYAKHFELALGKVEFKAGGPLIYVRGKRIGNPSASRAKLPVVLTSAEQTLGLMGMLDKYVIDVIPKLGNPRASNWPSAPEDAYDSITFAEFLRQRGASRGAIEILRLGYPDIWGDGVDAISALMLLRDMQFIVAGEANPEKYFVKGGNDRLPAAFAASRELRGVIKYSMPAVQITEDDKRVEVVCRGRNGLRRFSADRLICAIPFSTLGDVDLPAGISQGKRDAIAQLQYTSVTRVWIQTKTQVWTRNKLSGMANTDLPVMFVTAPTDYIGGSNGILEAYITGRRSRALRCKAGDALLSDAVASFNLIYPGVAAEYQCGTSFCWDDDEWARGAYPWFRPGEMTRLLPHIANPEGRLHFAGEHTSVLPGWMQGAFESGHRAAREVHEAA